MYLAIDKNGVGQYIEADSFDAAQSMCDCNGLRLVGKVVVILEAPGTN